MKPLLLVGIAIVILLSASEAVRGQEQGGVGATVFVDPLSASLRIRPASVQVTNEANARATIVNNGPAALGTVTATLLIDLQGVAVTGGVTRTVSSIAANSSVELVWRLCGLLPGRYLGMVHVSSGDGAERTFEAETTAALLEVTPRRGRLGSCQ